MRRLPLLPLAALLGSLWLPEAASAQVDIQFDPPVPIAGQGVSATVTFAQLDPESVSVFVRPLGQTTYQEVAATDDGGGMWSAALPFDVPAQGFEAYVVYDVDGQTSTEPARNPETAPYRIPALSLAAQSPTLPPRQYRMVSIPFVLGSAGGPVTLGSDDPLDVFGDDYGESGDAGLWRLLRWDPRLEQYRDAIQDRGLFETVRPGSGYWLISGSGGPFDVERGLSAGVTFDGSDVFPIDVTIPLLPGWNQIGTPYLFPTQWDDVGRPAGVEDPVAFQGTFAGMQSTLAPWEGYFVYNPGPQTTLRFRALPPIDIEVNETLAERAQRRAGRTASVIGVRAVAGDASDEVYLGLLDAPGAVSAPLDLRKPPALGDALRLAVRSDGEDWIGRFHTSTSASWTLSLTLPGGEAATLRLDASGRSLTDVAVEDLDLNRTLSLAGGSVEVRPVSGTTTRRLRISIGTASEPDAALTLLTPAPNPSAGTVALRYVLPATGPARLTVIDALGRTARVLHDGDQTEGEHTVRWDGRDGSGRPVAAGLYVVRLETSGRSVTTRLTRAR